MAMTTGARKDELMNLRGCDVSFKDSTGYLIVLTHAGKRTVQSPQRNPSVAAGCSINDFLETPKSFVQYFSMFIINEQCRIMNKHQTNELYTVKEQDTEILDVALNELANITGIRIKIDHYDYKNSGGCRYDALGSLTIGDETIPLAIELKAKSTLAMVGQAKPMQTNIRMLIVTSYVDPIMAERLKAQDVWFLDSAGNAHIKHPRLFIYIKGNKLTEKLATRASRAFYSSGLKVIYAFLCNPELINARYREIAEIAKVALGTVGWIIYDLTQLGFIVDMGSRGRRLKGKRKLLERWIISYTEKLRPKLEIGKYKALNPDWWQTIQLTPYQACWGSEVAADQLTHYLKPEIFTLYLPEKQATNLILTNKLRKDPAGNIELLKIFWGVDHETDNSLVNPILIYADLMASGDPRNIETAEIIYEQHLAQHFRED